MNFELNYEFSIRSFSIRIKLAKTEIFFQNEPVFNCLIFKWEYLVGSIEVSSIDLEVFNCIILSSLIFKWQYIGGKY